MKYASIALVLLVGIETAATPTTKPAVTPKPPIKCVQCTKGKPGKNQVKQACFDGTTDAEDCPTKTEACFVYSRQNSTSSEPKVVTRGCYNPDAFSKELKKAFEEIMTNKGKDASVSSFEKAQCASKTFTNDVKNGTVTSCAQTCTTDGCNNFQPEESSGLSTGAIVGIVIGSLLGVGLLVGLGFFFYKKYGHYDQAPQHENELQ